MFLVKQLKHLNSKEVRNFGTALNQIRDLNRNLDNTLRIKRSLNTKLTSCSDYGMTALRSTTPSFIVIRHHYRNTDYHPSRIVRAYRITRTWLTDHFVIADNRLENLYSFSMLLTTAILFVVAAWLNLQVGGEAGDFDTNKLKPKDSDKK